VETHHSDSGIVLLCETVRLQFRVLSIKMKLPRTAMCVNPVDYRAAFTHVLGYYFAKNKKIKKVAERGNVAKVSFSILFTVQNLTM